MCRYLRFKGYQVTHVMNLTDVDDKTIRGCREQGISLADYTKPFIEAFFEDLKTLNVHPADHYPAATDHIPEMIAMIASLMEKGFAYRSPDGSVYFSIDKFPNYGCLCRLDKSGLRPGARVAQDEYEKEHVGDFALWKAWVEEDGDVAWDSPWGRGRPGWHIECSAMSIKYLGETFDLHAGGVDNIFPHHDDEIAQSESVTGKTFVKTWVHCAHLIVEGKKMSKSAGNFYTLRDLLVEGYTGRDIRYELITTHYRQSLNFTMSGLKGARAALGRLDEFLRRLELLADGSSPAADQLPDWMKQGHSRFVAALDHDLNISGALGALFDTVHEGNKAMDRGDLSAAAAAAVREDWLSLDSVLGFLRPPEAEVDSEVLVLVDERQAARKARNWAESDRLRDEIVARGYLIQDTPDGPVVKRAG
mgnify:CR=1 FL=1